MTRIGTFVVIDIEATGLINPRITELCMIAVGRNALLKGDILSLPRIIDKLCLCVNPCCPIDNMAALLSGITNDDAELLRSFDSNMASIVQQFLMRQEMPVCLVAHNGNRFDFPILRDELHNAGIDLNDTTTLCIDSMRMQRVLEEDSGEMKFSLLDVYRRVCSRRTLERQHSAEGDCMALLEICRRQRDSVCRYADKNAVSFSSLNIKQSPSSSSPKYLVRTQLMPRQHPFSQSPPVFLQPTLPAEKVTDQATPVKLPSEMPTDQKEFSARRLLFGLTANGNGHDTLTAENNGSLDSDLAVSTNMKTVQ